MIIIITLALLASPPPLALGAAIIYKLTDKNKKCKIIK
jgi:hypothetical protein